MAGFNADDLKSRLGLKKEKKFRYTEETIYVEREENVNKFFMCISNIYGKLNNSFEIT